MKLSWSFAALFLSQLVHIVSVHGYPVIRHERSITLESRHIGETPLAELSSRYALEYSDEIATRDWKALLTTLWASLSLTISLVAMLTMHSIQQQGTTTTPVIPTLAAKLGINTPPNMNIRLSTRIQISIRASMVVSMSMSTPRNTNTAVRIVINLICIQTIITIPCLLTMEAHITRTPKAGGSRSLVYQRVLVKRGGKWKFKRM
ncbi:hypothetical protein D9619_009720 [Psilocybe cf. subviscida]|uniref:Uncharacterized protein n=1 Tax=Psilocybe cf. subviscida TaxID=2480587 RepID=A0A8H5BLT7_9AGAR|nr:hypothetical protein D9619_009720 [Psilocybe cf. subviscida]